MILALLVLLGCPPAGAPPDAEAPAGTAAPRFEEQAIEPWADGPKAPRVSIVVDARQPESGVMRVTQRFEGQRSHMWGLRATGVQKEVAIEDVSAVTPQGKPLPVRVDGRNIQVDGRPQEDYLVRYTVRPGGDGRHGHQGIVEAGFALFDGRVFLVPEGGASLRAARVRFLMPEGWTVASPLQEKGGWYAFDPYGPDKVLTALSGTCFGLGRFHEAKAPLGRSEVRVYTEDKTPADERRVMNDKSLAIFRWFHDALGHDPGFVQAVVWSPKHGKNRVYGGSSANGTCMDQPKLRERDFQLLSHRIGHAMNKYAPSGLSFREKTDRWMMEGWASYIEIIANQGAGVYPEGGRWNELYRTCLDTRRRKPEEDLPMLEEYKSPSSAHEFLHYFKAPLVMLLLDDFIQRHHGKDLTSFWKAMHDKYGHFQQPFPMREELEAWVGASLEPFWQVQVRDRGYLFPVWPEYYTDKIKQAASKPGAASVAGRPVSGEYLRFLAESGEFDRYEAIAAFVESEEARRQQLEAAGIRLLPPQFEPWRAGLPPEARYNLARAEANWPLPPTPVGPGVLVFNPDDADGAAFQTLLAHERAYEEAVNKGLLEKLVLQRKKADPKAAKEGEEAEKKEPTWEETLVFARKDEVRLEARWVQTAGMNTVRVLRDGEVLDERQRPVSPLWTRSWTPVESGRFGERGGVVSFQVETDSGKVVTRSFWRREP